MRVYEAMYLKQIFREVPASGNGVLLVVKQ
jgi:hypothetical protein